MKSIVAAFTILISASSIAETISKDGRTEKVSEDITTFTCEEFSVYSVERRLESEYFARVTGLTLGHAGDNSIIMHQTLIAKGNTLTEIPSIAELHPEHHKIDAARPYIQKPKACLSKNELLFSLWSGGNCSTVCEAWAWVEFDEQANVVKSAILNYQEYKALIAE